MLAAEVLIIMGELLSPVVEEWLSLPLPLRVWLLALCFTYAWICVMKVMA